MKNILLPLLILFSCTVFAQDFDKRWKIVYQYEVDGKLKSAEEEVQDIYKTAKRKKDDIQIIKCFFYLSKFRQVFDEYAQTIIIANLRQEIKEARPVSKAILNYIYAVILQNYSNFNSYIISQRTNLGNQKSSEFLTWTKQDFDREIEMAYDELMKDEKTLKRSSLASYKDLFDISPFTDAKKYSLYDILFEKHKDYYEQKISSWDYPGRPEQDILIKHLSQEPKFFVAQTVDNSLDKNQKKLIELLQNNERYYLQHDIEKVDYAFYKRLSYIKDHDENWKMYRPKIQALEKNTSNEFLKQQLRYERARLYVISATKNSATDLHKEALSLIDTIFSKKLNQNVLYEAESLKNNILEKKLDFGVPNVIYPNENFKAFIGFKNVDSIKVSYYRLPVANNKWLENIYVYQEKKTNKDSLIVAFTKTNKPEKTFVLQLPLVNNHFYHTTEMLMEKIAVGNYLVFIEAKNTLGKADNAYNYQHLVATNFAIVKDTNLENNLLYVLNRKTGKPIPSVKITNNQEKFLTDFNGKTALRIQKYTKDRVYDDKTTFTKDGDTVVQKYQRNLRYKQQNVAEHDYFAAKAMLYFDRAIYRPGQEMYYKGILFQKKDKQKSVVPFVTINLKIHDVNSTVIKEFDVQTNEFGSFSGKFNLPKETLTGQFYFTVDEGKNSEIDTNYYNHAEKLHAFWDEVEFETEDFYFQVEEYKRPTFEVKFKEVKENYTIGDAVKIRGNAKSLAGNNLTNAKVYYSISKNTIGVAGSNYFKNSDEIVDETLTDEKGDFAIDFLATENGVRNDSLERIDFHIKVDVTDSNGETRTANQDVSVGTKTLQLDFEMKDQMFLEDENKLFIVTSTLNNFPIFAKGEIKMYELRKKEFLKERSRELPDILSIPEKYFRQLFPHEAYNAADYQTTEHLLKTILFDTKTSTKVPLDFLKKIKTGNYKFVVTATDNRGNLITDQRNFMLSSRKNDYSETEIFTISDISKPNSDYIEILVQSVIPDLYINSLFYSDKKIVEKEEMLQLQNGKKIFKFDKKRLSNEDVYIHFSTIWENQFANKTHHISKAVIEKNLEFETISLRNKIEPGSIEQFSFKILNQKLEAEILASMYDSSLDIFAKSSWNKPYFYNEDHNPSYPYFDIERGSGPGTMRFNSYRRYLPTDFRQTKLDWFGFNFNDSQSIYSQKKYLDYIKLQTNVPKNATKITGIIVDSDGLGIPGVVVTVIGTGRVTQTDFNGFFEIDALKTESLTISSTGYEVKEISLNKTSTPTIVLEESNLLEELVIRSYEGKVSRSVTGSVTNVSSVYFDLEMAPLYNMLQGRAAGVNIASSGNRSTQIFTLRGTSYSDETKPLFIVDDLFFEGEVMEISSDEIDSIMLLNDPIEISKYGNKGKNGVVIITTKKAVQLLSNVKTRTNFNETAFFYPHLKTDANGQFSFNFTNPESLTRWKLRLYAHNKKAETGYFQADIISQKDVMIQTNMPRFVRENDTINISAKVVNMTHETKSGIAMLMLYDATNMKPIDSISLNTQNIRNFNCKPKESVAVNWMITIPEGLQGLQYKIVAKSGNFSDGEENILPVMSNKILITESIPIWVKGNTEKEYVFENLKNNTSTTLKNHLLTLEYTSNPVWFTLQSLPYLMEYEHECAEQTFSRYYGNFIATELINSNPKVASLFESWKNNSELTSKLNLNEELKSIVLNETPWLLDAESDELKNKRLALLMDLNTMKESMEKTFKKITDKQMPSGGFAWFDGGQENIYITQHIIAGLGHLTKMFPNKAAQFESIIEKAIPYLDNIYTKNSMLKKERINYYAYSNLHYLYVRSFYAEKMPVSKKIDTIMKVQKVEFKANWLHYSLYQKALLALTMHRFGDIDFAKKITAHLKETASRNTDNGMYWIENKNGYYWYQSSIETQALLIEAFSEIEKDKTYADEMKVWLLKNKQTSHWPTTKATTEAIYALLLQGNDWTSIKDNTKFKIGNEKVFTKKLASKDKEANTGYIKINWKADEIKEMGQISVDNKSAVPGYGGLYWQYFENLENIKTDSTSTLAITKNLYKKEKTTEGEKLIELTTENIKTGDLITIRLIIKTENDLEFVHLKDLRASCFEPVNVISQYQWKDRLSYYMSTKDVATHFFFDEIKKGTYVLEYDVRVNNAGHFSDGISTLQSMYVPEFSQHSKSSRVKVN